MAYNLDYKINIHGPILILINYWKINKWMEESNRRIQNNLCSYSDFEEVKCNSPLVRFSVTEFPSFKYAKEGGKKELYGGETNKDYLCQVIKVSINRDKSC